MVGGAAEDFETARPVLETLGSKPRDATTERMINAAVVDVGSPRSR
jgi:3-hydroxyisobutyrate dehydrogenase-like beta-hydroxyacid dehydrogenase